MKFTEGTPAERIASEIIELFATQMQPTTIRYDMFCALIVAETTLSVIPMYTGDINPKWKLWSDVVELIKGEVTKLTTE